ncbi:agamous-like MADS-box protein MADS2, partial [Bidens hawaiensis]|uniref:agamous-like MADS-box protein MADS2 n=1 Tax=Bidens hawaiensis TaxID=980011 RepID=UPI00404B2AA1
HRRIFGEDLSPLTLKELEQLEHQLDSTLRQIRSMRTQSMLDQLSDLQRKERMWLETNKFLQNTLKEYDLQNQEGPSWSGGENDNSFDQHQNQEQHPQHESFFQPLDCTNLQTGYNPVGSSQTTVSTSGQNVNVIIPKWML